jgi:hypothetical protein
VNRVTIVRVYDEYAMVFDVHEKGGEFTFDSSKKFDTGAELSLYLTKKKTIYLLFYSQNVIEETITLPSVIKNEATILSALSAKIRDENSNEDNILVNRFAMTTDPTGESTTHFYQGLYEKEILGAIEPLGYLHTLKRISVERYALFALSEEIYKGRSYLSVYTTPHRNVIIAGHKGELLFARMGEFSYQDEFERISEQVLDISRTAAYAKQQYREVNLEFIVISGSMVDMSAAVAQVQASTQIGVSVLVPSLIVKGLDKRTAQHSILEIGILFLPKYLNFLPDRVKAAYEFHLGSWIASAFALLFMVFGFVEAYSGSERYQESLDQHTRTKSELTQTLRRTDTLDQKKLQEITAQLEILKPLHHSLIDDLLPLEKVLMFHKPEALNYQENEGSSTLSLDFTYESKSLMDLYLFEKEFKKKVAEIGESEMVASYKTDYTAMTFKSTLKVPFPQEKNP